MFKWKTRLCSVIGLLAIAAATFAAGSASINSFGQPKEPEMLSELLRK